MNSSARPLLRFLAVAGLALGAGSAPANAPQNISVGELALLPEYCPDTQTFTPQGSPDGPTERQARWVGMLGKPFWGLHHYCWALINARRATQPGLTRGQREHLYRWAIGDTMYVVRLASPEFPLLPEMFLRIGQYQNELGLPALALEAFELSRNSKRDYWPAYQQIAQVYTRIGRNADALRILDEGLEAIPGSPQLTELRKRILATPTGKRAAPGPRDPAPRPPAARESAPVSAAAPSP
ncbi:MAG: hypothetical protein ING89_05990 [Rubrivivax sp.]|nr:hypothetical protein [Rubrivivax sp.]